MGVSALCSGACRYSSYSPAQMLQGSSSVSFSTVTMTNKAAKQADVVAWCESRHRPVAVVFGGKYKYTAEHPDGCWPPGCSEFSRVPDLGV